MYTLQNKNQSCRIRNPFFGLLCGSPIAAELNFVFRENRIVVGRKFAVRTVGQYLKDADVLNVSRKNIVEGFLVFFPALHFVKVVEGIHIGADIGRFPRIREPAFRHGHIGFGIGKCVEVSCQYGRNVTEFTGHFRTERGTPKLRLSAFMIEMRIEMREFFAAFLIEKEGIAADPGKRRIPAAARNSRCFREPETALLKKLETLLKIEDCGELTMDCLRGQSEKWKHLTSLVDEAVAGVKNEVVLLDCELEYIHDRIEELSSVDLQEKMWLNQNNDTGRISSYAELMCSLYDDCFLELVLKKAMEKYGHSNNALNGLYKLSSLLNNYEEPYTNGHIDDELIIKDSNWQVIVKQAQRVLANWDQIQPMLSQL